MSGEQRQYEVIIYFHDDSSTRPSSFNTTGWVAVINNESTEVKRFTKMWSKRRARTKARRWIKKRVRETTVINCVEKLGGLA